MNKTRRASWTYICVALYYIYLSCRIVFDLGRVVLFLIGLTMMQLTYQWDSYKIEVFSLHKLLFSFHALWEKLRHEGICFWKGRMSQGTTLRKWVCSPTGYEGGDRELGALWSLPISSCGACYKLAGFQAGP